jgi:hypothetical protein
VNPVAELLSRPPVVVNVGLREFADSLAAQDVAVVHVEWRPPPPQLDDELAALLKEIT